MQKLACTKNWHRDFNNELGRYNESDQIGLRGGINLYAYGQNNPISYKDSVGLYVEVGVREFYPRKVPYARHCFVRFNGNNKDTLSFDNKGVHQDPIPGGGTYSKTIGKDCADDCVRNEMKKCKGSDYDFFVYNCCMCVSNSLKACGLKKEDPWPNSPADATKPPYAPRTPTPPGTLVMPLGPTM